MNSKPIGDNLDTAILFYMTSFKIPAEHYANFRYINNLGYVLNWELVMQPLYGPSRDQNE